MEEKNEKAKKEHSCLYTLTVMFGIIMFIIVIVICIIAITTTISENKNSSNQNSDFNSDYAPSKPSLLERNATTNDIEVFSDLDLKSLGAKITITPQVDIDGLVIQLIFYDKNNNELASTMKELGTVKKGIPISFTISIMDLGIQVLWNARYVSIGVRGGTVSYFA